MGILGRGVYNLPEAARLTGLRPQRVREWFHGRPKERSCKPVFRSEYEANDRNAELVADWYKAHSKHVIAAVDFERSTAA